MTSYLMMSSSCADSLLRHLKWPPFRNDGGSTCWGFTCWGSTCQGFTCLGSTYEVSKYVEPPRVEAQYMWTLHMVRSSYVEHHGCAKCICGASTLNFLQIWRNLQDILQIWTNLQDILQIWGVQICILRTHGCANLNFLRNHGCAKLHFMQLSDRPILLTDTDIGIG